MPSQLCLSERYGLTSGAPVSNESHPSAYFTCLTIIIRCRRERKQLTKKMDTLTPRGHSPAARHESGYMNRKVSTAVDPTPVGQCSDLSLAGAATSIIFVAAKHLSRQTRVLSRQKYARRDKCKRIFVGQNFRRGKNCLSRQAYSNSR